MRARLTRESARLHHLRSLLLLALSCACAARAPGPPAPHHHEPKPGNGRPLVDEPPEVPPPLPGGLLTARLVAQPPLVLFAERPEYLASHLSLAFPDAVRPEHALLVQLQLQAGTNARVPRSDEANCPPSQLCLTYPGNNGYRFLPWLTDSAPFTAGHVRTLREQARSVLVQATQSFKGRAELHLGFSMSEDSHTIVGPAYLDSLSDAEFQAVLGDATRQATACVTAPSWVAPPDKEGATLPDAAPKGLHAKASAHSGPGTELRSLHLKSAGANQDKVSFAFAFPSRENQDPSQVLEQIRQSIEAKSLASGVQASVLPTLTGLAIEVSTEYLSDTMRVIRDVFTSVARPRARAPSPTGPGPDLGACERYRLAHPSDDASLPSPLLHFYLEGTLASGLPGVELVSVTSSHGQHLHVPHGAAAP